MSSIVKIKNIHGSINVEVHLRGRPTELFPLIHNYFPQASLCCANVAPMKYFRSSWHRNSSWHEFSLPSITPTEMKLVDVSLGRAADLFTPGQIKVAEELNHLLFRVLRKVDPLPDSYSESADVAVGITLDGGPDHTIPQLRTISNPETVSQIRIQSHYQVCPGCEPVSRWLPDLSSGRSQQCLGEVKLFSRSLGENHQKLLESVIEEVALFYRKRIRIRQQRIASLAHQVLGAEADAWLNETDYQGLTRLKRLDHSYEFEESAWPAIFPKSTEAASQTDSFVLWAGRLGHTFPFIARQTRAYLNFEVKDLRRPEAARLWRVLEFKVQMRFSAAAR